MAGHFITIEGSEGAGKSTQAARLSASLATSVTVVRTREPGGAPGAELLRDLLLHGAQDWSPLAEVMLHFAARAEHVEKVIAPALARGDWVVCDRFTDSTRAYQGYGQGARIDAIEALQRVLGIEPELTVMLRASPEVARARLAQRGGADRYERLGAAFFARVEEGFRRIAAAAPARCVVVAADGTEDEVAASVLAVVRDRFG